MGYDSIDEVLERGSVALDPNEFEDVVNRNGALILDTRTEKEFAESHIPGSVFIGLDGNFAPWVGTLITDLKQPIVYLCEKGREEEVVTRLSRVGYDFALGYLKGGIDAWKDAAKEVTSVDEVTAEDFAKIFNPETVTLLDVRKRSEFDSQHIIGATNFPLDFINENMNRLEREGEYFLHCKTGYRALATISILQARGFNNLVNIRGGFESLAETELNKSEYKEPSTML
jgi:rhodanese-related sulfurtransferase